MYETAQLLADPIELSAGLAARTLSILLGTIRNAVSDTAVERFHSQG